MQNRQLEHDQHQPQSRKYPLRLLAHNIEDPVNVGSLFRMADALGIETIYLSGTTARPPNTKINKTARSTIQYVKHSYQTDPFDLIQKLKSSGYRIISLEITTTSIPIQDIKISSQDKICLILGSENTGISQALLDLSDTSVHIPMLGVNSSMNVAMACSIACFEMISQL